MTKLKKSFYNRGQRDNSKGVFKLPNTSTDYLFTFSDRGMRKNDKENKSYREGWRHANKQKK